MAQPQGKQQQGGDNAYAPIWITVAIFIVCFLIWHFFKVQIITFAFHVNIIQAKIVSLFTSSINKDIYVMETVDPASVDFNQLIFMLRIVGDYVRYPVLAALIGLAAWLYFSNVTLKYKKTYSMKTLRAQEQHNWFQIMPVTKLDLIKENINEGKWAMAQSPIEFAKSNKLLRRDDYAVDDPSNPGKVMTATIRRGETKGVFTLQLGATFEGFEVMPIHLLALAAVFAARINRDRDGAKELLDSINQSVLKGKISFMGAKALLKKHVNVEIVQECAAKHAYILTVLASLLSKARDDGVLPSADFIWLKPIDRRAWYILNCIGRQTPFAEVSGIFAHWKAEMLMQRKSVVPMVEEAVNALEDAVKSVKLSQKELEAI